MNVKMTMYQKIIIIERGGRERNRVNNKRVEIILLQYNSKIIISMIYSQDTIPDMVMYTYQTHSCIITQAKR